MKMKRGGPSWRQSPYLHQEKTRVSPGLFFIYLNEFGYRVKVRFCKTRSAILVRIDSTIMTNPSQLFFCGAAYLACVAKKVPAIPSPKDTKGVRFNKASIMWPLIVI